MSTVLVLGSTGAVGSQVLAACLASPLVSSVVALGRTAPSSTDPKLITGTIDFDALLVNDPEAVQKLRAVQASEVIIALGTTRANAGSMEAFVKIDREYVLAAARAARVEGMKQRIVYCSSGGASPSSFFPYLKSKGLTEEGLASLGFTECIIFRPGMLKVPGGRNAGRLVESTAAKITGVLALLSDSVEIATPTLGRAMLRAAVEGKDALAKASLGKEEMLAGKPAWGIANKDSLALGKDIKAES